MLWIENLRSADWNQAGGLCLGAYLFGCFTAGYYLVRARTGQDVRQLGSGSVGARNVGRVLGVTGFFLALCFDFAKGSLVVWAARRFTMDDRLVALAMISVVGGHIWPAQLRFHGGKGMATTLGALLIYDPHLALTFGVLFICLFAALRKTLLPGLFSLTFLPLASMLRGDAPAKAVMLSALVGLVLMAHRRNLSEEVCQFAAHRHVQPKPEQPQP
jgi:acyl phosphate:glycerol-3-phosphate acyltransferase